MRTRFRVFIWILFSLVLYILFLGSRTEGIKTADEMSNLIFGIGDSDIQINEAIIKSRYKLLKNYDRLDSSGIYIHNSIFQLQKSIEKSEFLTEESLLQIKILNAEFTDKYQKTAYFKNLNSSYNNSFTVLPKLINLAIASKLGNRELLEDHLTHIMYYYLEGNKQGYEKSIDSINKIKKTFPENSPIGRAIVKHSEVILYTKKELDRTVSEILDNSFSYTLEKVGLLIIEGFDKILYRSNVFSTLLYSLSLGVLLYAAYLLIRVFAGSYALRKMNENLVTLNKSFAKFVPTESLQILSIDSITTIELGKGVKKEMTVLFSDIRSFTTLSEKMSPEENFDFINSYLREMGPIVRQNKGFIDKFIGDAIMALFKEDPEDAIKAGIQMISELKKYNIEHRNTNNRPPIEIGIGVHSGEMMFGTVGENDRMETTVISDTVNLASRIESITKFYGVGFLISGHIYESLDNPDIYKIRFVDRVRVKGKSRPIPIYEVFDADPPDIQSLKLYTRQDLELAIKKFYNRDPKYALELLKKCKAQFPDDPVIRYHYDRCKKNIPRLIEPEEEWEDATEPRF